MVGGKHLSNVFSNMNVAEYVVVGQNPGSDEAEKREPFVGISGKMFDQLVEEVLEMKREKFYITNTVKCVSPGNRKPFVHEVCNCESFLDREISILQPRAIISLGGPALEQLAGIHGIMKHHGKPVFSPKHKVFIFPLLHPSPLNLNDPVKLELFVKDLVLLKEFMDRGSRP